MEHPAVLTDGEDSNERGAVLDMEGESHRSWVFERECVVIEINQTHTPDEVLGVWRGV